MQCFWHKPRPQTNLQSQFMEKPKCWDLTATLRAERQLYKQELLMADLAQKWLIIKQQRKLHSDSPGASQRIVSNFFFSSLGRDQALRWMAFTSLFFAVLTIVGLFSALGSRFSSVFSELYAGNCLLSARLCQDPICKNCGSLQMLWPWKFLAQTPQLCLNSTVYRHCLLSLY